MIRVLLVDDHEMVRLGVSSYLSIQSDVEVVGEAENGEEGYEKAMDLRPDVILMKRSIQLSKLEHLVIYLKRRQLMKSPMLSVRPIMANVF